MIEYKKHTLSRLVTVLEIVSADYIRGIRPATYRHAHQEAWELCTCLEGTVCVVRSDKQILLSPGQSLFIRPGTLHCVSAAEETSDVFVISFTCTNDENLLPLQSIVLSAGESQVTLIEKMKEELEGAYERPAEQLYLYRFDPAEDPPLGAEQAICCYLELSILQYLRSVTMEQGRIVRSSRFEASIHAFLAERVTRYVDEHLGEPLSVEGIASHFHYSRARLSTIYKSITGLGINEMITQKRINAAKRLLWEKEKTVAQIAEELGFSSQAYFSRRFTAAVGCPPSKFAALSESDP